MNSPCAYPSRVALPLPLLLLLDRAVPYRCKLQAVL